MAVTWGFDVAAYLRSHPGAVPTYMLEVTAFNANTGADETFLWADGEFIPAEDTLPAVIRREALITKGITYQSAAASAPENAYGLLEQPRAGAVSIGGLPGEVDWIMRGGIVWEGATAKLKVGVSRVCTYPNAPLLFTQTIKAAKQVSPGQVTFELADRGELLRVPIQNRVFSGSDWLLNLTAGSSVDFGTAAALQLTGTVPFTAIVRFRAKTLANRGLIGWAPAATTGAAFPWAIQLRSTGVVRFMVNTNSAGDQLDSVSTVHAANTPYTLAVSQRGTTVTFILVNHLTGVVTEEALTYSGTLVRPSPHASQSLAIGKFNASGGTNDLIVDWAGVFQWAQPRSWVEELSNRQLTTAEAAKASCLGFWRFEEGTGTSIADSSATGATGTVTGGVWCWSLEGGEQLEGQLKPARFGAIERCDPVQVRAIPRIWCVDGWKWNAITMVDEGGSNLSAGTTAYTDPETFAAASAPTAGGYDTLIWNGGTYIRLGSNPSLPIAVKGQGAVNLAGTYVNTCDGIAKAVCERVLASSLSALWTSFALDNTRVLLLDAREAATAEEAVAYLCRSVGGAAYFDRGGLLKGGRLTGVGGTDPVLYADRRSIFSVTQQVAAAAVTRLRQTWLLNGVVLDQSDVSLPQQNTAVEFYATSEGKQLSSFAKPVKGRLASEREWRTGLTTRADAQAVGAAVIAAIGGRQPRAFEVVLDIAGAQLEPFDHVGLRFTAETAGGRILPAYGLGEGGNEANGGCMVMTRSSGGSAATVVGDQTGLVSDQFTAEAWFICEDDPDDIDPASGAQCILAFEDASTDDKHHVRALVVDDNSDYGEPGALVWLWETSAGDVLTLATPFSVMDRQWHHAAFVRDGSNHAIWVDGKRAAVCNRGGSLASGTQTLSVAATGQADAPWAGALRDIRWWTSARTGAQIWNSRFFPADGTPALHLRLDAAVPASSLVSAKRDLQLSWFGTPVFANRDQLLPFGWGHTLAVILSVTDEIGDHLGKVRLVVVMDH